MRLGLGVPPHADASDHATAALSRALRLWEPDVVWIHHLSGLAMQVGPALLRGDVPLAVTLHDYWWMCPRGQLLDRDDERCRGPAPRRCAACVAPGAPPPWRPLVRRATAAWLAGRERMARATLEGARALLAPSAHVAHRYAAWLGTREVTVRPNPRPRLARRRPPVRGGPLRCGFFGALLPGKGIETLLRAAARATPGSVRLEVFGPLPAGDGWRAWRRRVRALAARAGAALRGPYAPADAGELMAGIEVVCLPSRWEENAPLVLDEARAVGRAVLASDIGGIPEIAGDPRTSWLLPPDDVEAWSHALSQAERLRGLARAAWEASPPVDTADRDLLATLDQVRPR